MNISRFQTDKLIVGTNDVSYFAPDQSPTGTAVLNGPVYIGEPTMSLLAGGYEGVLNVASRPAVQNPLDTQPPIEADLAIQCDGNMVIRGDGKTKEALVISGGGGIDVLHVKGDATFDGAVDCGNKGALAARFGVADSKPKPFDLEHPTKGKGHRLRYACIEGPEVAVYCRGRLKESNVIQLHLTPLIYHDNKLQLRGLQYMHNEVDDLLLLLDVLNQMVLVLHQQSQI